MPDDTKPLTIAELTAAVQDLTDRLSAAEETLRGYHDVWARIQALETKLAPYGAAHEGLPERFAALEAKLRHFL